MIEVYELSRKGCSVYKVLSCEYRRFPTDVALVLTYSFETGELRFKHTHSWSALQMTDCIYKFLELIKSPHWREEIQPMLKKEESYNLF